MMRYPSSSTSFSAMVVLLFFLASSTGIVLGDDSSSSSSSSSSISSSSDGGGGGGGGAGCTKFSINGSTTPAGYFFTRHRFYDFRRIDNNSIAPDETTLSNSTVSRSVNDTSWTDDWNISVKQVSDYSTDSTVSLQFSADNVYIR